MPDVPHRPYALVVFDWDGTAVADRREDTTALRERMLALLHRGVFLLIVTGTHLANLTRQLHLSGHPLPRGRLYAATNRGSEIVTFAPDGEPIPLYLRHATPAENQALDTVATRLKALLESESGLPVAVVFNRLNRRKIDLIPDPPWADPPKARIGDLWRAVQDRYAPTPLAAEPLRFAMHAAHRLAAEAGLPEARITSDVKHVEVGLTDKSDVMRWVMDTLAPSLGIPPEDILVAGDEFGSPTPFPGSDAKMRIPQAAAATFVSVGPEPHGVPPGVLHLGGGPERFRTMLTDLARYAPAALPELFIPTLDANWLHVEPGFLAQSEHEVESRLALSNGYSGTRGALMERGPYSHAATFLAGVFSPGRQGFDELVLAPFWPALEIEAASEPLRLDRGKWLLHRRILDLRRGLLLRVWRHRTPDGRITRIHEARWASLADRHAFFQQIWLVPENYTGEIVLSGALDGTLRDIEGDRHLEALGADETPALLLRTLQADYRLAFVGRNESAPPQRPATWIGNAIVTQRWTFEGRMGTPILLKRAYAVYTDRDGPEPLAMAHAHAKLLEPLNLDEQAARHEAVWRERWDAADVRVLGDKEAQKALRFATFHLIAAAYPEDPRVSVGAKALTGEGYKGHVFWDTELYMLPFYLHTYPPAARALLMYRFHTLPAARLRAEAMGWQGALYAWESTDTGEEATPEAIIGFNGEPMPIYTGKLAHHVNAAVVFAVWKYWESTRDRAFMAEAGTEIVLEVARFWASRVEADDQGKFHIRHVLGPDEYHVDVDDNAYTNEMARFCLELGARFAHWLARERPERWREISQRMRLSEADLDAWGVMARDLVTGFDPVRGLHEQFAGYFDLVDMPLLPHAIGGLPLDITLGPKVRETQIIKQADVVMLMRLLWDRFPPEVRAANFHYYEPRTSHGSSLSPAVHALVAAKLGETEKAMEYFRFAAAIDLGNRMGNASEGIHAAALGGLWQATIFGFAGLHVYEDALAVDPAIPEEWEQLEFPFHYLGSRLHFTIRPTELTIEAPRAVPVRLGREERRLLAPGRHRARCKGGTWTWVESAAP